MTDPTSDALAATGFSASSDLDALKRTLLCLVATVEHLQAEVDRLTALLTETTRQRDAADTVIRRFDSGWVADDEEPWWTVTLHSAYCEWAESEREPMDPDEAGALRRARATQPQEPTND